jgi:hypothetical protein
MTVSVRMDSHDFGLLYPHPESAFRSDAYVDPDEAT